MKITERLKDKRILIWGYGREGKSTEAFLNKYCQVKYLEIFQGKENGIDYSKYDYVIKSPGIRLEHYNEKVTSQTELFLEEFASQTIGITGTKGKSTTSTLLYQTLSHCKGDHVILVGNIGLPCLDRYDEIDQDTIIVYEMSCHQLCLTRFSPHIAVFLNLFEDHLDYYDTMDRYFTAKSHITTYQSAEDHYYHGDNVPAIETKATEHVICYDHSEPFKMLLKGTHNQFNARFVYEICSEIYGCQEDEILEAIGDFSGLHHRLEYVDCIDGVEYYNDSISTIPEATIEAIGSIRNTKTVLIGGMDRGIDYDILIDFIKAHAEYNYILSYESGERIYKEVAELPYCYYEKTLFKSVDLAKRITPEGSACVLSPAAASYGYFKNFEERGTVYSDYVRDNRKKNETTLVFTGDIGFDRYMDGRYNDDKLLSPEVISFMQDSDHVIANVEGPLVRQKRNTTTSGAVQLMHTMDPDVTKVLERASVDIWNLCNNHIMDAGDYGVECTLKEAEKHGVKTIGAGMDLNEAKKPLYLKEAGGIGMFAVGYRRGCKPAGENKAGCFLWNEMEMIEETIHEIKKTCRWCIIVAHGGEEFTALPSPYTRDRYLKYLEMGADIVVSHHPHVPMNYELVGEKAIFYSLGNFIFDTDYQRAQYNTDTGILLKLKLTEENFSFEPMGIKIVRGPEIIVKGDVPKIFCNVPEDQYELLSPLAAKMFIAATKRQQIYMNEDRFLHATDEEWAEHFANPKRSGRVPGEGLDFFIICPLAERESEKAWEKSTLEAVKTFILKQMN